MRLVLISPEGERADEAVLVTEFVRRGLTRYHVRKPGWSRERLQGLLERLSPDVRRCCVLHSCHDLVDTHVLLGRHWRDEPGIPHDPGSGFTSRSCHEPATLVSSLGRYSSVFYSPVFPSLSKAPYGTNSILGPVPEILRARSERQHATEVLALGGITPERVFSCAAWGFDGVAVLGHVWQAPQPVAELERLLAAVRLEANHAS